MVPASNRLNVISSGNYSRKPIDHGHHLHIRGHYVVYNRQYCNCILVSISNKMQKVKAIIKIVTAFNSDFSLVEQNILNIQCLVLFSFRFELVTYLNIVSQINYFNSRAVQKGRGSREGKFLFLIRTFVIANRNLLCVFIQLM